MDGEYFDELELRDPELRERNLFSRLPDFLHYAMRHAPGWARLLEGVEPRAVRDRAALARLPVLRKSDLPALQAKDPPFGGLTVRPALGGRVFISPGPIIEPQASGADPFCAARALFAAGFRRDDVVHNAFAYHITPGGFVLDEGARALGCLVFPAGTGNTEAQLEAIAALRPVGYTGTPDFLKILLDRAAELGRDVSCLKRALVSGAALSETLREHLQGRGIIVRQCYATAELGVIAYESDALEGMILNEDLILEIVRPGTGEPVPDGEVGEVVVTSFNPGYPLIRFATGDLSAVLPGPSPCGRTNMRIRGWMGRADQAVKVKGMFVHPGQIAAVLARHPEIRRARLVVCRVGEQDEMTLQVEPAGGQAIALPAVEASLREVTRLGGRVEAVAEGTLPEDGKVIEDKRPLS